MNELLVSVVIPCYNHGHYLPVAVESVLSQSYKNIEVIVVDDGSGDNTREVARSHGDRVRYIYKQNAGLSAARNTGIEQAKGSFLLFLDADDWLYPNAIQVNVQHLLKNPQAAFVSGAHDKIFEEENYIVPVLKKINSEHYNHFLSIGNYIGVPAAVLFQRWILDIYRFDEGLKACEDYDLYLRIARSYPVLHHTESVAAYRIRSNSMSSNPLFMLKSALYVLRNQESKLKSLGEKKAFLKGVDFWERYYCNDLINNIANRKYKISLSYISFLTRNHPKYLIKLLAIFKFK